MTRTDHAAQATSALALGQQAALAVFMAAQAEATLALVEQQRVANLIALAAASHPMLSEQVATDAAQALAVFVPHSMGGYFRARPDVAAALGIVVPGDPEYVAETS